MIHPFFSIVVPVYNVEKYLNACLETLVAQTFSNYEIILVDDGSTDKSGEICDDWKLRFMDRIRVIHQQNMGLLMARTTGFGIARGEYFVIVDSDDVLHVKALETIHKYIEEYAADVVIYQASEKTDFSTPISVLPFADGEIFSIDTNCEFRRRMGSTFSMNSLWTKAFRRELAHLQTQECAHISQGEDLVYSLPMLDKAERVVYCRQVLYYYRPNPNSITRTYKPALFRSLRDTLRLQRSYALKWDPSGELAAACDVNGLWHFFDDVIARIMRSSCSYKEKRGYMLEMVTDADFLRDYAQIRKVSSPKARICLRLAKNKCFWPMYMYGAFRNMIARIKA